jgi:excinuclease ABC subunit A
MPEIEPRLFSFNNPFGACDECKGLGYKMAIDENLILGDTSRSLAQGALTISGWNLDSSRMTQMYFSSLAKTYGFSLDTPIKDLPKDVLNMLLYGNGGEKIQMQYSTRTFSGSFNSSYEGVIPNLERRYRETSSEMVKTEIARYMRDVPCTVCHGKRLKPEALAVTVGGVNIYELCEMSVVKMDKFMGELKLTNTEEMIAHRILKEIHARLNFLINVGLGYLTLSRSASTLSGGESQRIRLATQIGSGLTGVLYILDEPALDCIKETIKNCSTP